MQMPQLQFATTKTTDENLREACERADVVVLATGQIESYSPELFHDGQIIIDVGTGTGKDGSSLGTLTLAHWS